MILNCAIVDDEPLALELLRSYVEKTSFLRLVGRYSSAVQAMTEIPLHEEVHVLFLDIQMPELNGLEFSRMVSPETRIIFTTAFGQYALDSYKVNALDYLLKPISYVDFLQSVNKAVQWYELKQKADNGVDADEADDCIYVKSDYGDGTVLYISQVQMDVVSIEYVTDSITGIKLKSKVNAEKDSIQYTGRTFNSTREIIQANRLANDTEAIQKCIDNSDWTYLKSPAGIFTQVTLPVSQIAEKLEGDTLNAVKLGIPIYNETSDKKFGMSMPRNVLLIRKKYKESFFENNQLSDGVTSSLFTQTSSTTNLTEYTYNNITKLINDCLKDRAAADKEIQEKKSITFQTFNDEGKIENHTVNNIKDWEELSDWNKAILIPVLVTTDASSNGYYGSSSNVIGIQHDLKPGYVRLKGGLKGEEKDSQGNPVYPENILKLEVVSTNFGSTKAK